MSCIQSHTPPLSSSRLMNSRQHCQTPSSVLRKRPPRALGSAPASAQSVKSNKKRSVAAEGEITAREINLRIKTLFGSDGDDSAATASTVERPCVSARLFACYSLYAERSDLFVAPLGTPRRSTRHSQSNKYITPALPLLQALVHVEVVALGGSDVSVQSANLSAKQTQFSGFDCSSTQPPVDRVDGSAAHQQDSMEALTKAKDQVETLMLLDAAENQPCRSCLDALLLFLRTVLQGNDATGVSLRRECAKSIAVNYPPPRIQKAVAVYSQELQTVLARLEGSTTGTGTDCLTVLSVEQRLAEFIGQAVRYNLRRFFNRAPPRLSPSDTKYDSRLNSYSQVLSLFEMVMPGEHENAAVDDECISALFSTALCRLYEFFGLESLLDAGQQPTTALPVLFCHSPASNRALSIRGGTEPWTDQDVSDILDDIDDATSFMAAAKGSRFLLDLLQIKGVQAEIQRQGGWLDVETHASISWKYDLWKLCPSDAHLVVLCNYSAFLHKLQTLVPLMEQQVWSCQASLDALGTRFHVNTKSKNLLTKYPQIPTIAEHLQEGLTRAHSFPLINAFK